MLSYKAPDDLTYDSPEEYLFIGILGGCGCGTSEEIAKDVMTLLLEISKGEREKIYEDSYNELIAHMLDSKDLIEHGSQIGGSWLTEKGESIIKEYKRFYNL